MRRALPLLLGLCLPEGISSTPSSRAGAATRRHNTPPVEINLVSPPIEDSDPSLEDPQSSDEQTACTTNQDGFGGALGAGVFTVSYNYELEMLGSRQDPVDELIFSVENSVANFLLGTDTFTNVPCDGRRLEKFPGDEESRKLQAVGISINPRDEPSTAFQCSNQPKDGNECILVDGGFQAYTVGNADQDAELQNTLKEEIRLAMESGKFNNAHIEVVKVTYVELEPSILDEVNSDPNRVRGSISSGSNPSVIIGASVGALLVLGALVFYRRRKSKEDEAELGTQGANSNIV